MLVDQATGAYVSDVLLPARSADAKLQQCFRCLAQLRRLIETYPS